MNPKQDAIEEDVSEEQEEQEKLLPEDDPRMQIMEDIIEQNKNADEQYEKDTQSDIIEPELPPDEQEPDLEDVETESEKPAEEEKPPEPEETVHLIIDGQEKDVPLSEVTDAGKRALQKQLAADKRLEEATQLLREAKERALPPKEDVPPKPPEPETERMDAAALAKAIQYGTEDEAAQALAQFQETTTVTPERVSELVEKRVQQLEQEQAQKTFWENVKRKPEDGGFADLMEDEVIAFPAFFAASDRLLNAGEPNTWETYQKAGEEVRELLKTRYGGPDLESKKASKRAAADDVPRGTNQRQAPPPEEKPQTKQQILDEMRKSRGQL